MIKHTPLSSKKSSQRSSSQCFTQVQLCPIRLLYRTRVPTTLISILVDFRRHSHFMNHPCFFKLQHPNDTFLQGHLLKRSSATFRNSDILLILQNNMAFQFSRKKSKGQMGYFSVKNIHYGYSTWSSYPKYLQG